MTAPRRIFVSMPADQWLDTQENDLKWSIVDKIEALGYTTEVFFDPRGGKPGLAASSAWSAIEADNVLRAAWAPLSSGCRAGILILPGEK